MSYAPTKAIKRVIGTFKDTDGTSFDYEANSPDDSRLPVVSWPHRVWISNASIDEELGTGWRYACVMTNVVYLVDNEVRGPRRWAPNKKLAIKDHITYR